MNRAAQMNQFLADVEKRAFRMAQVAVRDVEEALDIVQDAMFTLAEKYSHKPVAEWRPLFYRILQNRIMDSHRRNTVKSRIFGFFSADDDDPADPMEKVAGNPADDPDFRTALDGAADELQSALAELPHRQQQAFLLRTLEGLSVAETAQAMRCSDGSVKTHYSRAVHRLRDVLGEHWQ